MSPARGVVNKKGALELTASDHTKAIRLVMENPEVVGRAMAALKRRPDPESIAAAAFDAVPTIPAELREKLHAVVAASRAMRAATAKTTARHRAAADALKADVAAQASVAAKLGLLKKLRGAKRFVGKPHLAAGVDVAIDLLEDGLDSIYAVDFPFYSKLATVAVTPRQATKDTKESAPSQVAGSDVDGAIDGALIGGAAGLIGGAIIVPPAAAATGVGGAIGGGLTGGIIASAKSASALIEGWWNKLVPRS